MWSRISLRSRIYALLAVLVLITLFGGLVSIWYSYRMERVLAAIIEKNLVAFKSAQALETALTNQKGFVSYYFMDGDPAWLSRLGEHRQIFRERLDRVRQSAENNEQKKAVAQIEVKYANYVAAKDQVIELYKARERSAGAQLHRSVRNQFFEVLALCEAYKEIHLNQINTARLSSRSQARRLRISAVVAILSVTLLTTLLFFVMVKHVLGPIRRLSSEVDREGTSQKNPDEIKALSRTVHGLIEDIDKTYSELEKSREHLLQAEKLALVGKLAAGMAHSIRNPFTSVKMRLFSLHRALNLNAHQKEDFQVISEEILHIDNIVQNFLEFSRPPKLKMQKISPSEVVDLAFRLLRHRLESYNVEMKLNRKKILPEIVADPERLKEALVNIVVNACEAMKGGGFIIIDEEEVFEESLGQIILIRLTDSGPGIPEAIQRKVFEPFFTTKEEGSGLGLSIAARIVEEHGGRLDLTSKADEGSSFTMTLPVNPVR